MMQVVGVFRMTDEVSFLSLQHSHQFLENLKVGMLYR